jgi:hypothetical protein
LTGIFPVLGKSVIGGDVRGADRNRAAEALHDREVERTKPGAGAIDPTLNLPAGWSARAMILRRVNLLNVKGITAMFCSLTHGNPASATTHANISFLMERVSSVSDSKGSGLVRHALPARAASRRRAVGGPGRIPTLDELQFGKQAA